MGLIELAIMAAMVLFNGRVRRLRNRAGGRDDRPPASLAPREPRGAKAALFMKQNMEASLAAMQVAMTLLGASAAAIGGVGAAESIKPFFQEHLGLSAVAAEVLAIVVVVIPLTFLTILLGELMPKVFSLRNKEWVCLRLSPVMRWFCFSVWPAVWLFETSVMAMMAWSERRWRPRMDPAMKSEADRAARASCRTPPRPGRRG